MLNKTIITLAVALTIGAVSTAQSYYEFDGSGAPINMHIVDGQDAFASADAPALWSQPTGFFSAQEQALFDRASRPNHLGEETDAR